MRIAVELDKEMPIESIMKFRDAKREFERLYCCVLLTTTKGNISEAARLAGKDRKDLHDVLKRTGVDANDFRTPEQQAQERKRQRIVVRRARVRNSADLKGLTNQGLEGLAEQG
jgi:predicted HTH domain antitoxin